MGRQHFSKSGVVSARCIGSARWAVYRTWTAGVLAGECPSLDLGEMAGGQGHPRVGGRARLFELAIICCLVLISWPVVESGYVVNAQNAKVTLDNNNVDGFIATPSFDARNRGEQETSIAIDPVNPKIVAIASIDQRLSKAWLAINISSDGGATWFNTMIPGFFTDTSLAGLLSPLSGMEFSGDPAIRFDAAGNFYVSGVAERRTFMPGNVPDNILYVAKYRYTPGTTGGVSTPNSAANPPDFTYLSTSVVERGAISFARPDTSVVPFSGQVEDKPWLAVDTTPTSPCFGNIYVVHTKVTVGDSPILFSRSTDGGSTFSQSIPISVQGKDGSNATNGSNIGVGSDGRIYVSFSDRAENSVDVVRSDDCGRHFSKPVQAASDFTPMQVFEPGLRLGTFTIPWLAVDDTNPDTLYVAYMAKTGNPSNADIFVARSTDGGITWEPSVRVNDDVTKKHQFFPAMAVSKGALHVAWYDFRDSPNPGLPSATNSVLNVYYASSNAAGVVYPAFGNNIKVTTAGFDPRCIGVRQFIGDYIELAARFDGSQHVVHLAWSDARDIPSSKCFSIPPGDVFTGFSNTNIYTARLLVAP